MIPKEFLINYEELKVGDPLWSAWHGDVTVSDLDSCEDHAYRIEIKTSKGTHFHFTETGKYSSVDSLPTLFKSCPYKEEERLVEVSKDNKEWFKRVLVSKSRGFFLCYKWAETIDAVDAVNGLVSWCFMREITEPKKVVLTRAEIAEKFGIDPNAEIVVE